MSSMKHDDSSRSATGSAGPGDARALASVDALSPLLARLRLRTRLFHAGPLCGRQDYEARPELGHFHLMLRGRLDLHHRASSGLPRRQRIDGPCVVFYPRPQWHRFEHLQASDNEFVCATVAYDGGASHPLAAALPAVVVLPLEQLPSLGPTVALLAAEASHPQAGAGVLADRLCEVLLIQLLRHLVAQPSRSGLSLGWLGGLAHPGLARVMAALHARPAQPWPLAEMAAVAGMSRSAFALAFKQAVGCTPAAHLAAWRLSLVQQGLLRGEPVKRLADEFGFGSASALSRRFAQVHGVSPRDWLARQRLGD